MTNIIRWPAILTPEECRAYPVAFTRSGGRTLGGVKPAYRTDLGHWRIEYVNVPLATVRQRRTFDAIMAELGGTSGRIIAPVWSSDSAPYVTGSEEDIVHTRFGDGSTFSDGSTFTQGAVTVLAGSAAPLGATTITLNIVNGLQEVAGVRFSYKDALYQTGAIISQSGPLVTVRVTPSVRQSIPAGATLEFDRPCCVSNLFEDAGMVRSMNANRFEQVNVSFVEDTKYWSDIAAGIIT